jgi:hypothetical protein
VYVYVFTHTHTHTHYWSRRLGVSQWARPVAAPPPSMHLQQRLEFCRVTFKVTLCSKFSRALTFSEFIPRHERISHLLGLLPRRVGHVGAADGDFSTRLLPGGMPLVIQTHTHTCRWLYTHICARIHARTHTLSHTQPTGLETSDADAGYPRRQVSTSLHVRFGATWLGGGRGRGGRRTRRLLWRERARGQWQHILESPLYSNFM